MRRRVIPQIIVNTPAATWFSTSCTIPRLASSLSLPLVQRKPLGRLIQYNNCGQTVDVICTPPVWLCRISHMIRPSADLQSAEFIFDSIQDLFISSSPPFSYFPPLTLLPNVARRVKNACAECAKTRPLPFNCPGDRKQFLPRSPLAGKGARTEHQQIDRPKRRRRASDVRTPALSV